MNYKELKFNENTTFLVTGGAGFIGSNLCEAILGMGYQVKCLDDLSTGKLANVEDFIHHENFEWIQGDIRDLELCMKACKGVDFVLHQAAWGSVPRSIKMPVEYEQINVLGTVNMLEAARQNQVQKFVYASSAAVYGDSEKQPKIEGEEGQILSPYALTKRINEEYASLYTSLYGLKTYGLRYFNVFGKKQDPAGQYAAAVPKFIKQLLNDETPEIYGDGLQTRDFVYIENVIEANLKACLASDACAGQAFNVAYGHQDHLLHIYQVICKTLGKDVQPIFTEEKQGDIKHSSADINKIKRLFGYEPMYDFEAGISLSIEWYKQNL